MTPHCLAFMSFGFTEILVVGVVALLVFGGRLPEVMRNVGQAYAKFRQGLHEISKPVRDELRSVSDVTHTQSYSPPKRRPKPRAVEKAKAQEAAPPKTEDTPSEAPKAPRSSASYLDDEPPPV